MTALLYLIIGIICVIGAAAFVGVLLYMLGVDGDDGVKDRVKHLREKGII